MALSKKTAIVSDVYIQWMLQTCVCATVCGAVSNRRPKTSIQLNAAVVVLFFVFFYYSFSIVQLWWLDGFFLHCFQQQTMWRLEDTCFICPLLPKWFFLGERKTWRWTQRLPKRPPMLFAKCTIFECEHLNYRNKTRGGWEDIANKIRHNVER